MEGHDIDNHRDKEVEPILLQQTAQKRTQLPVRAPPLFFHLTGRLYLSLFSCFYSAAPAWDPTFDQHL